MSYIGNISSRLSVSDDRGLYQHIHMHNLFVFQYVTGGCSYMNKAHFHNLFLWGGAASES